MPPGMIRIQARPETGHMPPEGMRDTSRFGTRRMNMPPGGIRDTSRSQEQFDRRMIQVILIKELK